MLKSFWGYLMVPIWVLAPIKFSVSLHINIEVISTWILCLQNFGLKKHFVDRQNRCSHKSTFFGGEDICYCPRALPLTCPPSQDLTSKSCISQAPLPVGLWWDFVKEITLGDRMFGGGRWGEVRGWGNGGAAKDIVTFSLLWVSSLVMWLFLLRALSLGQAA